MDSALHSKLARRAAKRNARGEQVASWRLATSASSLMGYLFWRNRYPVVTRLLVRGFLFFELYLLLSVYRFSAAAALSGLLFTLFLCQQLFQGCVQHYRVHIANAIQENQFDRAQKLVWSLVSLGVLFGVLLAVLVFGVVLFVSEEALFVLLAALLLVVLPVQLWSSSLWSAVYIFHRLPRNFWVIVAFRALPSVALLTLSSTFGPLLYGIAVSLARLLEAVYLGYLASRALHKFFNRSSDEPSGMFRKLLWPGSAVESIERVVFYAAPAVYSGMVAVALLLTHPFYWVTYFAFFYLTITLLYIPWRLPQSLAMDVYLGLRRGSLFLAGRFIRISRNVGLLALVVFVAGFIAAVSVFSQYLVFQAPFLWKLSGYMALILIARGLHGIALIAVRAACLEQLVVRVHTVLFLFAALLQLWGVVWKEVDLNYVLLVEAVLYLLSGLVLLSAKAQFRKSPLLDGVVRTARGRTISSPLLWLSTHGELPLFHRRYGLIQIDPSYRSRPAEEQIATQLSQQISGVELSIMRCCPGYLFFVASSPEKYPDLEATCIEICPGLVRNVYLFGEESIEKEYEQSVLVMKQSREYHRSLKSLKERIASRRFKRLLFDDFESFEIESVSQLEEKFEQLRKRFPLAPALAVRRGAKLVQYGKVERRFKLFAGESLGRSSFSRCVLPVMSGSIVVFSCMGIPLLFIDCYKIDSATRERVMDHSVLFSIAAVYSLVKNQRFAEEFRRYCSFPDICENLVPEQTASGQAGSALAQPVPGV